MVIKESGKNWILVGIVVLALSFGMVGNVGAYIEIRDLGIDLFDEGIGFIDFKNEVEDIFLEEDEEYNVTGAMKVYNDGTLIYKENITLEVISFHGFAVNRVDTREFRINVITGIHNLTAYINSEGETSEIVYEYEIYEVVVEVEGGGEGIEEDWLPCP